MLTSQDFVRKSLETNLFWSRIMKEHMIFLHGGFPCKEADLIQQAEHLKNGFTALLMETVNLANGVVSQESIDSQQFVTPRTMAAEQKVQALTGIFIDTGVTQAEMALRGNLSPISPQLESTVYYLNQKCLQWVNAVVNYKALVLNLVQKCSVFNWNFPTTLDHVVREAMEYRSALIRLQSRIDPDEVSLITDLEAFWNHIMEEHSEFMEHYLDPAEKELIKKTQAFADRFHKLTAEAKRAGANQSAVSTVTRRSLNATASLRDFKVQGTELILMCRIKSLISPLFADHVTREANHYLQILRHFLADIHA